MFLIAHRLGVPFEGFGELLENCRGRPDVFGFWKESGGPNLIAFFELFLWGTLKIWQEFVILIICILHKGQKWASVIGINLIHPCLIIFFFLNGNLLEHFSWRVFSPMAFSSFPIDVWVVPFEPREA
jgi:hypothetical protein